MKIEDYGFLSDTQTAALVGRNGSVDWLCFPRFDSAACFAALLGEPKNGRCWIALGDQSAEVTRKYRGHTLILETTFETKDGAVRLIDFMPPRGTNPDIIRIVEGVRGKVAMRMELIIRFDYGDVVPWVRKCGDGLAASSPRRRRRCRKKSAVCATGIIASAGCAMRPSRFSH